MNKTELKEARERYFALSKMIKSASADKLIKETTNQQEERIKRLLKPENYLDFFEFYFGVKSGLPLADAPSSQFHLESYLKLYDDKFIKQFRRWFRGAAKSIHTNVGNLLALKQCDEVNFALIIGRNQNAGKILIQDIQAHLESNEIFKKDFGPQMSYGSWADGEFETNDGKHFKALGLNQPFRGLRFGAARPDFASIDDVEDRDAAKNKDQVRKYGDKIVGDLGKAFHKNRGRMVFANNYIVKNGINDYVLNKYKDNKHLHCQTINLTDEKGKPTWPERYSQEDVDTIIANDDYYTSQREDFNNPIEEGKLFKAEKIIQRSVHGNEVFDGFLSHWDLSYTSAGDYKAGVLLGVKDLELTVLEVFCQRCDINSAMEIHFQWQEKYRNKGTLPLSFYDATAAQQAVYAPIIQQCAEDSKSPYVPMPMHQGGDKHNKIEATILSALHRGILFWDDSLEGKDYDEFMDQVLSFEKGTSGNDDAPDTLTHAIIYAQLYYGYSKEKDSRKPIIGKRKKKRRV